LYGKGSNHETWAREAGGTNEKPLLPDTERPNTLTELFQLIRPNEAVPAVIVEADRRRAEAAARDAQLGPVPGAHPPSTSEPGVSSESEIMSTQQAACTPDYYGDHWYGDYCGWPESVT
jgi:hypothetical protein